MRSSESAITAVFSNDVPEGRYISTANWLRSAMGISFCGIVFINNTPSTTAATPRASVVFVWRKHQAIILLYDRCSTSSSEGVVWCFHFSRPDCTRMFSPCSFSRGFSGLRMNWYCRKGTNSSATSSDVNSTIEMAHGNDSRKSSGMPVTVNRMGKNVTEMASVAEKMLRKKWRELSMLASRRCRSYSACGKSCGSAPSFSR